MHKKYRCLQQPYIWLNTLKFNFCSLLGWEFTLIKVSGGVHNMVCKYKQFRFFLFSPISFCCFKMSVIVVSLLSFSKTNCVTKHKFCQLMCWFGRIHDSVESKNIFYCLYSFRSTTELAAATYLRLVFCIVTRYVFRTPGTHTLCLNCKFFLATI